MGVGTQAEAHAHAYAHEERLSCTQQRLLFRMGFACLEKLLVLLAFVAMLLVNFKFASKSQFQQIGSSYVDPDPLTFSVWGLIYAFWLVFVIAQLVGDIGKIATNRFLVMAVFASNALWLVVNSQKLYWIAVWVLATYAYLLNVLYERMEVNYKNGGAQLILFPAVSSNLAWAILATTVNFSDTVVTEGWQTGPQWAMGIVYLAALLSVAKTIFKLDIFYVAVTCWAFLGIYRYQLPESDFPMDKSDQLRNIASWTAVGLAGFALLALACHLLHMVFSSRSVKIPCAYKVIMGTHNKCSSIENPLLA